MKLILKAITIIFIELINLLTRFNYNYKLSTANKERLNMKERKLIQVKYPPFDQSVKSYNDIYKYEDQMTDKDYKKLEDEISKNNQWLYGKD